MVACAPRAQSRPDMRNMLQYAIHDLRVCVCERTLLVLSVCVLCVYVCVDANVVVCVLLLDRYQGLHFVGPTFVCLWIAAGLILRVVLMLIMVMC